MINRRDVVHLAGLAALSIGAGAVGLRPQDNDWITLCSKETSSNGLTYGEPELIQILRDVQPGMQVREWCFGPGDEGRLDNLLGIVAESRRLGHSIQLKVRWFKRKPVGSFVTLHGTAQLTKDRRFEWLTISRLDVSSAGSAFNSATAV